MQTSSQNSIHCRIKLISLSRKSKKVLLHHRCSGNLWMMAMSIREKMADSQYQGLVNRELFIRLATEKNTNMNEMNGVHDDSVARTTL